MPLNQEPSSPFDSIKRITSKGTEYWMARELYPMLGYSSWDKFAKVLERAKMACESSGAPPEHHFHRTVKLVSIGSGAQREREDCWLSRYACYLVAMNGDPSRVPEIGAAQTYFAIQTRRQEIAEQKSLTDAEKRLDLRARVSVANKHLNSAAKDAGVQRYALFHDAGYRGMYGGLGVSKVKEVKGIPPKEKLLDRIGRTELAAHEFRITQTEEALKREGIQGERQANETHHKVGRAVRKTIRRLGGTMPEDLPAEEDIKKLKSAPKPGIRAFLTK